MFALKAVSTVDLYPSPHSPTDKSLWAREVRQWGQFDPVAYAQLYPDLKFPRCLLSRHYLRHGMFECRMPNAQVLMDEYKRSRHIDPQSNVPLIIRMIRENAPELRGELSYVDLNTACITDIIRDWGEFDPDFYLLCNPDVAIKNIGAFEHFCQSGIFECRDPNAAMNVREFCLNNEDKNFAAAPAIFWMMK